MKKKTKKQLTTRKQNVACLERFRALKICVLNHSATRPPSYRGECSSDEFILIFYGSSNVVEPVESSEIALFCIHGFL